MQNITITNLLSLAAYLDVGLCLAVHSPVFPCRSCWTMRPKGPGPLWLGDVSLGTSVSLERIRKGNCKKVLTGVKSGWKQRAWESRGDRGKGTACPGWPAISFPWTWLQSMACSCHGPLCLLCGPACCLLPPSAEPSRFVEGVCSLAFVAGCRLQQHCAWEVDKEDSTDDSCEALRIAT